MLSSLSKSYVWKTPKVTLQITCVAKWLQCRFFTINTKRTLHELKMWPRIALREFDRIRKIYIATFGKRLCCSVRNFRGEYKSKFPKFRRGLHRASLWTWSVCFWIDFLSTAWKVETLKALSSKGRIFSDLKQRFLVANAAGLNSYEFWRLQITSESNTNFVL